MKKNNKGFTLVELVAVVVILIIIFVIAITMANRQMEKSKVNSFLAEANVFSKGAMQKHANDKDEDILVDDVFHNVVDGRVCYSITEKTLDKYVSKTKNNYRGSVEVCYGPECTYATKIWITDGKHYINGLTEVANESQVSNSFSSPYPESCGVMAIGGGSTGDLRTADFDYTGGEQVFNVLHDGLYSLETWGAQGGDITARYVGGFGGYSYVEVFLKKGDKLYVNVGQKGSEYCPSSDTCTPAYNGGARGSMYVGGGGGATHIATKSGELRNVPIQYVYIVSGGGSGAIKAEYSTDGGAGGGYETGNSPTGQYSTTIVSGAFYGGISPTQSNYRGDGGGYGSGAASSLNYDTYGSRYASNHPLGGTGYVFNTKTKNGVMYCYNRGCGLNGKSFDVAKTVINTEYSETPIPQTSKLGNGYARITYLSSQEDNSVNEYYSYGANYQNMEIHGSLASFKSDKIHVEIVGNNNRTVIYTPVVDLSKYNTVIYKASGDLSSNRLLFTTNPTDVTGVSSEEYTPTFTSLGDGLYAADISSETRSNLRLAWQFVNLSAAYDVKYLAFSTKTIEEVSQNHSFIPDL